MKRRGAALVLALVVLALMGAWLASASVRAYGVKTEQRRAERRIRLRTALWDAAFHRLESVGREKGKVSGPVEREAPDGVRTAVTVSRVADEKGSRPPRYAVSITAAWGPDKREAWMLVQPAGSGVKCLTWVER